MCAGRDLHRTGLQHDVPDHADPGQLRPHPRRHRPARAAAARPRGALWFTFFESDRLLNFKVCTDLAQCYTAGSAGTLLRWFILNSALLGFCSIDAPCRHAPLIRSPHALHRCTTCSMTSCCCRRATSSSMAPARRCAHVYKTALDMLPRAADPSEVLKCDTQLQ